MHLYVERIALSFLNFFLKDSEKIVLGTKMMLMISWKMLVRTVAVTTYKFSVYIFFTKITRIYHDFDVSPLIQTFNCRESLRWAQP